MHHHSFFKEVCVVLQTTFIITREFIHSLHYHINAQTKIDYFDKEQR